MPEMTRTLLAVFSITMRGGGGRIDVPSDTRPPDAFSCIQGGCGGQPRDRSPGQRHRPRPHDRATGRRVRFPPGNSEPSVCCAPAGLLLRATFLDPFSDFRNGPSHEVPDFAWARQPTAFRKPVDVRS